MGDNLAFFDEVLGLMLGLCLFHHYIGHIHAWRAVLRDPDVGSNCWGGCVWEMRSGSDSTLCMAIMRQGSSVSLHGSGWPKWLMKCVRLIPWCDNEFLQSEPMNTSAGCLWPAILCSNFLSIQGVGRVGGGTSQDPRIFDRIKRPILMFLLIRSMLPFLYTPL